MSKRRRPSLDGKGHRGHSQNEKASKKSKVPHVLRKIVSEDDLDSIRVYILTRKIDDTSDDSVESNWKKADYRVLKNVPNFNDDDRDDDSDDDCEEEEPRKIVERTLACNISDFSSGLSEDTEGVEELRVGFLLENQSSISVKFIISIDDSEQIGSIVPKGTTRLLKDHKNKDAGFVQDFLIRKSKMAQDESEVVDRSMVDKFGLINVSVYKCTFAHRGTSIKDKTAPISNKSEIKIKESMIKTGAAMSFKFGAVKKIYEISSRVSNYYEIEEKLMTMEIKYRNYIGFLVELARANIPIEQKQTSTQEDSILEEVIEIESDEDENTETATEIEPPQPTLIPTLPPFKSQSLMSKVKETISQIESKSTEDLIKFIKLIDEDLYKSLKDPFQKEHIDGTVFLSLTGVELKDLGIRIGEQIKIKQIIQQVRENK